MSKKCKKEECPAGEKWAVPYADFLSLLLALFIALFAISSRDVDKSKALAASFVSIFDSPPKPDRSMPVIIIPPPPGDVRENSQSSSLNTSVRVSSPTKVITFTQLSNLVEEGGLLEHLEQGAILRMPSDILFDRGKSDLSDSDKIGALELLITTISKLPSEVTINVRGYTDDTAVPADYSDNYKLAADRAYNVMKFLVSRGVSPSRLSYTSYGEHSPLAPNTSEVNRRANNRVEIYFSARGAVMNQVEGILDRAK